MSIAGPPPPPPMKSADERQVELIAAALRIKPGADLVTVAKDRHRNRLAYAARKAAAAAWRSNNTYYGA